MKPQIFIVEDENIVARDLQNTLTNLGYSVCGIYATGEEAYRMACKNQPDLVLMDIMLTKGFLDGITTAQRMKSELDVPVIFITAYSDERTLRRAKVTQAYGYVLKPFNIRELQIAIEMALYRHHMDKQTRAGGQWFATTLKSIGDAVVATDAEGKIIFVNPAAEGLVDCKAEEVREKDISDIFQITGNDGREHPVAETLARKVKVVHNWEVLLNVNGRPPVPVVCTASPIEDPRGGLLGVVTVFRDIREISREREELANKVKSIESKKRLLERYFPEHLVDYLVDEQHVTDLQGRNVQATIMFCDIRDSTGIAEDLMPGRFAQFLSDFYEGIMDLTYANGGSVNKFLGDGLLITFGCPLPEENDTINCVRLALQVREYIKAYNANSPPYLRKKVQMGMGISSGLVFAGNVGCRRHMDYTVLGDAVNTASRLESLTKTTGCDILVDLETARRVEADIEIRALGQMQIRGKREMVEAFHALRLR